MKIKAPKLKERCSLANCKRRAKCKRTCITCERLVEAGKREEVFELFACNLHQEDVLAQVKAHALKAHPFNILRATLAALKGEDVF